MAWTVLTSADEVPEDEGRRIELDDHILAVFRVGDEYFVTDDLCTHGESSLAEGYVEPDCAVECISHMARFSLRTGEVLAPPATVPLKVYPVRVEDDKVLVDLDG